MNTETEYYQSRVNEIRAKHENSEVEMPLYEVDDLTYYEHKLRLAKAIDEALGRFNGYWANDYTVCDEVAKKYGYDKSVFASQVYKKAKDRF